MITCIVVHVTVHGLLSSIARYLSHDVLNYEFFSVATLHVWDSIRDRINLDAVMPVSFMLCRSFGVNLTVTTFDLICFVWFMILFYSVRICPYLSVMP